MRLSVDFERLVYWGKLISGTARTELIGKEKTTPNQGRRSKRAPIYNENSITKLMSGINNGKVRKHSKIKLNLCKKDLQAKKSNGYLEAIGSHKARPSLEGHSQIGIDMGVQRIGQCACQFGCAYDSKSSRHWTFKLKVSTTDIFQRK